MSYIKSNISTLNSRLIIYLGIQKAFHEVNSANVCQNGICKCTSSIEACAHPEFCSNDMCIGMKDKNITI